MEQNPLRALAEAAGLARQYEDARGDLQTIGDETLALVLERLGLPADSERRAKESLEALARAKGGTLPPLITADQDKPALVPGHRRGDGFAIALEGGGRIEGRLSGGRGGARLPAVAEPGYHRLSLGDHETVLAVAPPTCHWPSGAGEHLWGVAAQVYRLRRLADGGIGDFTAVAELAEAMGRAGAHALAVSPVHAMFPADPGRASPYSPSNRLLLNGLLIDPAARFGASRVAEAASALDLTDTRDRCEGARLIEWETAGRAKLALLRRLFDELDRASDTGRAFDEYRQRADAEIENHAVFDLLHATLRDAEGNPQHWRDWGADYADPSAPGVARMRAERPRDVVFHVFLQWLAADGLRGAQQRARAAGMPIGLIADLAVGADGGGSQAWASRADLLTGLHMGAPPDIYNAKGQDWGLAALDPHRLRRTGFAPFLRMLRASLAWAGGIRIDHILGLHRIWVIPEGSPPTAGAYLHFPLKDLLRLVTLESLRHEAVVIGEDLGTVPGGLRRDLAERRILGMSVLWFEQDDGRFTAPRRWRRESAAMTTTHDLPTVAGWWSGNDLDWKERLDLYPTAEHAAEARADRERERAGLWRAMRRSAAATGALPPEESPPVDEALAHVARTPCRLALLPLEDLLAEREQPNLPGTITEHPNWRRRLEADCYGTQDEAVARRLAIISQGREAAARSDA